MILIFVSTQMLLFLIYCFSLIILLKSPKLCKMVKLLLLTPNFWVKLYKSFLGFIRKKGLKFRVFEIGFLRTVLKSHENLEGLELNNVGIITLLDLHDLALDLVLDQLSPAELCSLAGVCSYLRSKCRSNYLWVKHLDKKWGKVIGNAALREWHWYMANNNRNYSECVGLFESVSRVWPLSLMFSRKMKRKSEVKGEFPPDSVMAWYLSLERGEFWFPAQVYNRENGHDGFMLSCYDAKLSYDLKTDTFQARYSPHGRRTIEENISWSRLRTPPIDTPPYNLHVSDCLDDLRPGDHFEIQWRRNKAYPYGWWYGVIGHLESCSGNEHHCICHKSETVIMEFNQYAPESRWRRKKVSRKNHREEGNEADGFYGGIRKLYSQEEISIWKSLWPTKVLN
ncbi:hypothetical protein RND81_05G183300 [Saponaria officinalis]|uniref:F-box domain-containing protein n=1 Tax=Saponaria officinalis TaxID=3572 RepID=A0AAW1KZY1_SAPOF